MDTTNGRIRQGGRVVTEADRDAAVTLIGVDLYRAVHLVDLDQRALEVKTVGVRIPIGAVELGSYTDLASSHDGGAGDHQAQQREQPGNRRRDYRTAAEHFDSRNGEHSDGRQYEEQDE